MRGIWRFALRRVNPLPQWVSIDRPPLSSDLGTEAAGRAGSAALPALKVLATLLLAAIAVGARASPGAPLADWLDAIGASAQALADGDPAGAELGARAALVARPSGEAAARAELALGAALRDAQRFAEAVEPLRRSLSGLPDRALASSARFILAQCFFYSRDPAAAAALYAEVARTGPAPLASRARWREPDALLEAGRAEEAIRAWERLLREERGSSAAPGARVSLAAALRTRGDPAGALALYQALWRERPADPAARAAGRALSAWRAAGGPVPEPTPDERLARVDRLLELSLPRRALKSLERLEVARLSPEPASRALLLRAFALLQIGRREEAERLAREVLGKRGAGGGTRTGAEVILARVAARSGRRDEAVRRYAALSRAPAPRDVPGLSPAQERGLPEDAAYLVAWLAFDAGDLKRALVEFRLFAKAHPRSARADDARWFEAWTLYRLGRREEARGAFGRVARGGLEPAAGYWQARLAGTKERQRELYGHVIRTAPVGSWYALLAASRLEGLGGAVPISPAVPPAALPDGPGGGGTGEALARAARLLGAGLVHEALHELRALANSREARPRAALIAQLAEAAGDAELPFRVARDGLPADRRALRWLFPRAFADLVTRASAQARVDPLLYLAVMRRESAFRPDARSGAGAVGLVQLIPPTSERVAQVHGVAEGEVRALEKPAVSVPLGAAYLALLDERFRDPAVVLAAYNAGPTAAASWARARAGQPLDEWAESVPYRETRRYVKNVSADAAVYRWLWEGGKLSIDPERRIPAPREGVGF